MALVPKGGRGVKAPYETIGMRIPAPIKSDVEQLIRSYRDRVLSGGESSLEPHNKPVYNYCVKLVDTFVQEKGLDRSLTSPRSQNLYRFRDWLKDKCALEK